MKIIPYGKQQITAEDKKAVLETLDSDFLTQGPKVVQFEKAFAEYVGAKFAVAVSNGTAALHIAALALGCNNKSKVITTPVTFAASANCVRYCGGEIIFADIDPETYLIDLNKVEDLLKKEKGINGIIPVDFAGYPIDTVALRTLVDKYGVWILEDACHAPGASLSTEKGEVKSGSGDFSDASIFSFHPVKHIATGEGGMVTTNSEEVFKHLQLLRTHGITKEPEQLSKVDGGWYYEMIELGFNYRLTDIQASLGLSQLNRANVGLQRRKEIADRYTKELKSLPVKTPIVREGVNHSWHLYIIQTEQRKELYDFLKNYNIFCQVHYIPVHLLAYYQKLGWQKGDFPTAENYYDKCLSLPIFPSLQEEEQEYVIEKIKEFFEI